MNLIGRRTRQAYATRRPETGRASTRVTPQRAAPRRAPFLLLVAGLVVGGLWMLLALNTAAAADEVQTAQVTAADAGTQDQVAQLQVNVAARQAPASLAAAATRLGMIPDTNPVFLVRGADGTVRVLGTAIKVTVPPAPVIPPAAPTKPVTVTTLPGGPR